MIVNVYNVNDNCTLVVVVDGAMLIHWSMPNGSSVDREMQRLHIEEATKILFGSLSQGSSDRGDFVEGTSCEACCIKRN